VLPGNGYIRYQPEPGDATEPPGELIVLHEERRPAPPPQLQAAEEAPPTQPRYRPLPCAAERGKLLARLLEMQGLQVDPEFAVWMDRNRAMGNGGAPNLFLLGGDPLLLTAVRTDGIARSLAEDLSRCEATHSAR
jgi:hypothetical protein